MKNKIIFIVIILLVFMILLIPLKGSYAFYSDNKDLDIINTKVGDWNTLLGYLRMNDKNYNLSKDTPGDMYRYQGTEGVNNWICFGTTDNCGTNDELIDKYMYRIIGITKEGQLYLLKETFIKEGTITSFAWNDKNVIDAGANLCPNSICPEWNESLLFKRINGKIDGSIVGKGNCDHSTCDGANTDIFVDSEYYDYLKSGDSYNGTKDEKGSSWYQLIEEHDWMYGDTNETKYNGNYMYAIETGQTETTHKVQKPTGSKTIVTETYKWSEKVTAKISLMYLHDVIYAYPGGNPGSATNVAKSWVHFQKDGYNTLIDYEWLSTRFEVENNDNVVRARRIGSDGLLSVFYLANTLGVRPVFYLNSDVMITKGSGTKENPFIIQN